MTCEVQRQAPTDQVYRVTTKTSWQFHASLVIIITHLSCHCTLSAGHSMVTPPKLPPPPPPPTHTHTHTTRPLLTWALERCHTCQELDRVNGSGNRVHKIPYSSTLGNPPLVQVNCDTLRRQGNRHGARLLRRVGVGVGVGVLRGGATRGRNLASKQVV